ncbi:MAG: TetR/AcrR family transcriptional regulator [Thermomicrobiales bacterium]
METENAVALAVAPGLEMLWDDEVRAPRRRRVGLTREDIVATAVEMADRSGLSAISMANIAKALGFSTMAIYRHVPNKAELLLLMEDAGIGPPPEPGRELSGWRAKLEWIALEIAALYRRRPWLLAIPITGPPATPNNIRWLELGLAALKETNLVPADRFAAYFLVVSLIQGDLRFHAEIERGNQRGAVRDDNHEELYGLLLTRLMPPGKFPEVEEMIASGVLDQVDEEGVDFEFALQRVLDGIEVFIEAKSHAQ